MARTPRRKNKNRRTNAMPVGKHNTYRKPKNPIERLRPITKSYGYVKNYGITNRVTNINDKLYKKEVNGETFYLNNGHQSHIDPNTTDERACPGCCTAVCGGQTPGTCRCSCNESTNNYWDLGCNCLQMASIQYGYSTQAQACMEHCASPGGGSGYEIPCTCAYSIQQCINSGCTGGSCGTHHDSECTNYVTCWNGSTACYGHCPAQCPDSMFDADGNYIPQYTAGGMQIHVPGCDPWSNQVDNPGKGGR